MDDRLRNLFDSAAMSVGVQPDNGCGLALVAVGGYGRSELSPASDVDVVLLHDPAFADDSVAAVAQRVWYPLWDDGVLLDHAVRSTRAMHEAAGVDVRTATGMLDARAVAGDISLVQALRSGVLGAWRRHARERLPQLREACDDRVRRAGWLAHAAVPDLKDSGGGLRDGVVMRALVSTWLIDVPRHETEPLRRSLLDVRDALHEASGRRTDRLTAEQLPDVAALLDLTPTELDLHVRELGWRTAHLAQLAWRRIDGVLRPHRRRRMSSTGPKIERIDTGVGLLEGEVVFTRDAKPRLDGNLALRAAVAAAGDGHILSPRVAARCADDDAAAPPTPWSESTRDLMVELLASGPEVIPVWEELDIAGVVDRWLPEWSGIRLRGSSSPVHTYTIDRHSLQTVVNAAGLVRRVRRPDLLVVAALLHDIGKGASGDHSVVGAPIARTIATRWGFSAGDADRIGLLVRRHLLLPTAATRRDIEDPATAERIAELVGDRDTLDLLAALTEADATATGPTAWTKWRAGLVRGLVEKTRERLDPATASPDPEGYDGWDFGPPPALGERGIVVRRLDHHTGTLVAVDALDRPGLMADVAAGFALAGLRVRSARTDDGPHAVSMLWEVADDVDVTRLDPLLRRVLDGQIDPGERLTYASRPGRPVPVVTVLPGQSATSSVIDVRADDARGLLWACCRAITSCGVTIRSAHATTIGPQADDVFYVVGDDGEPLADDAVRDLAEALEAALV